MTKYCIFGISTAEGMPEEARHPEADRYIAVKRNLDGFFFYTLHNGLSGGIA